MIIQRILNILEEKSLTASELCKYLGINTSTMTNWKNRNTDPPAKYITPICEFLGVSYEYLLTGKDNDEDNSSEEHGFFFFFFDEKDIFIQRLTSAIADAGLSEDDFKASAPIGSEKASSLLGGESEPSANDLIELSNFLNSSIDYLLGQVPAISNDEKKLLNTFVKLDDDNRDILIGEAKKLLKSQYSNSPVAADEKKQEAK